MLLNELPPEIIVNISLRLSMDKKFSLMLTCKRLNELIYQSTFFDTLELYGDKESIEPILFKFRKNRAIGERVKILKLDLSTLSDQLFSEIPLLFPNVEAFEDLDDLDLTDEVPRSEQVTNNFLKWSGTIKRLGSSYDRGSKLLYILLEKNVFSRLTRLGIEALKDGKISLNVLDCIKNAPLLVFLELSTCTLTIDGIETIHFSAPLLTTLHLRSIIVSVTKEETLPKDMTPASNMASLLIDEISIIDENCLFLEYITQKYDSLIKCEFRPNFQDSVLDLHFPGQTRREQRSNSNFTAILQRVCDTLKAYEDSGTNILSNLPATLKEFSIHSFDMKNAMTMFTPKFSNLQYLDYFYIHGFIRDEFKQPESIDTLKNLIKLTTLKLVLEPSIHQYNHQGPLSSSITKIDVGIKGKTCRDDMDIGWIFAMFPSINHLKIWWSGARLIGYERSQPIICPNLTKLNLGSVVTHPNILKFICDCAPNLKDLYWNIFAKKEKNDQICDSEIQVEEPDTKKGVAYYHIDLTGFSLDCFHLHIDLQEGPKDKRENVYLSLKQKHGIKHEFITLKEYSLILPKNHNLFPKSKAPVKAKIKIKYDFTKKIDINSKLVLDLENSKVMSGFSWW